MTGRPTVCVGMARGDADGKALPLGYLANAIVAIGRKRGWEEETDEGSRTDVDSRDGPERGEHGRRGDEGVALISLGEWEGRERYER